MFSLKTLVAAALTVAPLASASIMGFTIPSTAKAGDNITATVTANIGISNSDEYSIIWGLLNATEVSCSQDICIGTQVTYTNLYPKVPVPLPGKNKYTISIPEDTDAGDWKIVAAIPTLVGASGEVFINTYNQSITIEA